MYGHLYGHEGSLIKEWTANENVRVEINDKLCSDISSFVKDEVSKISPKKINKDLQNTIEKTIDPSEINNLISGTGNLINYIAKRANTNDGIYNNIDTLVFLDLSARNGAYLFETMWDEFSKRGDIPKDVKKPNIRFMDIGRGDDGKYSNPTSLTLLRSKFNPEDFTENGVLVIDEYMDSGDSARRASKVLYEAFGSKAHGVAQFSTTPKWYKSGKLGIKGVTETAVDKGVANDLRNIDEEKLLKLQELVKDSTDEEFENLYQRAFEEPSTVTTIYEDDARVVFLKNLVNECSFLTPNSASDIISFVDSAGGFLSSPLETKKLKSNNLIYRQVLKAIVTGYMQNKDA